MSRTYAMHIRVLYDRFSREDKFIEITNKLYKFISLSLTLSFSLSLSLLVTLV